MNIRDVNNFISNPRSTGVPSRFLLFFTFVLSSLYPLTVWFFYFLSCVRSPFQVLLRRVHSFRLVLFPVSSLVGVDVGAQGSFFVPPS